MAFCVAFLSVVASSVSAQIGFAVNPHYSPVTPNYTEIEYCGSSNDANFSDPFGCPELITFPEYGDKIVVQGYMDSTDAGYFVDVYRFVLTDSTEIQMTLKGSHLMTAGVLLSNSTQDHFECLTEAFVPAPDPIQYGIFEDAESEIGFNLSLPPGFYILAIIHQDLDLEEGVFNLPCGSMEYQFELSQNQYDPGDLCGLAIEIDPEDTFNESRVMDNMADAYSFGAFDCATDIGQTERWYKFTAEKSTSFISARREGVGNFNPVIEVYDSCGGVPVRCQDNDQGAQELIVFPTEPDQEYFFRVYHKGPQALTNTALSAAVAHIPSTQLRPQDCNRFDLEYTDIIRSDWPSNSFLLTTWEFKFEMMEPPYDVHEIISPNGSNPQFRMSWFPQAAPGKTYRVSTRPRMYQGPTWGDYAGTCLIGTAPDFAAYSVSNTPQVRFEEAPVFGSHDLRVWPNPAHGEAIISFNSGAEDHGALIRVFDASGKLIDNFQKSVSGAAVQNAVYDTSALPAGVYLVRVQTESGTSTTKLVVTR